jgi:uncharacterized protein
VDASLLRSPRIKADPAAQLALLDLQELDSRADQLRHQRAHLPELAEIATLNGARTEIDDRRRDAQIAVDDLTTEQKKVDLDVEQVKARRSRDQQRMDQGLITNPKDLERMQGELASLERRIGTLEDEELEVMARLEDAEKDLSAATQELAATDDQLSALGASRDEKTSDLERSLADVEAERGPAVALIPADLVALYDRLRASKGGVGVGALHRRECGGCRLTLDASELAEVRAAPADEVLRHEECQRILVRTPESGL